VYVLLTEEVRGGVERQTSVCEQSYINQVTQLFYVFALVMKNNYVHHGWLNVLAAEEICIVMSTPDHRN
jgi:hypothetical protein